MHPVTTPARAELETKFGRHAVTVNAPASCGWELPAANSIDSADTRVIVAFVVHRRDMELLSAVFAAVNNGCTAWVAYPKLGRLDTDLDRIWLFRALYRYDVGPVTSISIDETWAAVLMRPALFTDSDIDAILAWPDTARTAQRLQTKTCCPC